MNRERWQRVAVIIDGLDVFDEGEQVRVRSGLSSRGSTDKDAPDDAQAHASICSATICCSHLRALTGISRSGLAGRTTQWEEMAR